MIKKIILLIIASLLITSMVFYSRKQYMRNLPNPKPIHLTDAMRTNTIENYLLHDVSEGYSIAVARVTAVHFKSDIKRDIKEAIYRHPFESNADRYPITGEFTTIKLLFGKPIPENNTVDNSHAIKIWNDEINKIAQTGKIIYYHCQSPASPPNMRLGEYWIVVYDPIKKQILTSLGNGTSPLTGQDDPLIDAFTLALKFRRISDRNEALDKAESVLNDKSSTNLQKDIAIYMAQYNPNNIYHIYMRDQNGDLRTNRLILSLLSQKGISYDLRMDAIQFALLAPEYIRTNTDTRLLCQYMMSAFKNSSHEELKRDIQSKFNSLLTCYNDAPNIYYFPEIYILLKAQNSYYVPDIDYSKIMQRANDHIIHIAPLGKDAVSQTLYEASFE